jgi:hypothetical protein
MINVYPTKLVLGEKEYKVVPNMMPGWLNIVRNHAIKIDEMEKGMSAIGTTFTFAREMYYVVGGHVYGKIFVPDTNPRYGKPKVTQVMAYVGRF